MKIITSAKKRRPPVKREMVVGHLRQLIIDGTLAPGDRLATHKELERQFDAESPTIRAAMRVLGENGFIETRHRSGSFVAKHPPHLSHFALAFPLPVLKGASRFYEAIRDEAAKLQAPERRISTFYEINSRADVDDYQRLLGFVQAHRLAGLIFAGNPGPLEWSGLPLFQDPGVVRTAVMMPDPRVPYTYPTVYPDIKAFLPAAFKYLAEHGRKRVAVVLLNDSPTSQLGPIQDLAAERGLIIRPHWVQAAFVGAPEWTRQSALMMLHAGQAERPDAVVITDDNLVDGFTAGIRDSGIRVGTAGIGDLEVVAQANFPYPTLSHVPAKRLGYNITKLMATCLERIEQQRRGEPLPAHTAIPAEFAES